MFGGLYFSMCHLLVYMSQDQGNQTSVIKDDDEMEEEREGVEADYDGVLHHADVSCNVCVVHVYVCIEKYSNSRVWVYVFTCVYWSVHLLCSVAYLFHYHGQHMLVVFISMYVHMCIILRSL